MCDRYRKSTFSSECMDGQPKMKSGFYLIWLHRPGLHGGVKWSTYVCSPQKEVVLSKVQRMRKACDILHSETKMKIDWIKGSFFLEKFYENIGFSELSSIFPLNFLKELVIGWGLKFEFKSWVLIGCKKVGGKIDEKSDKVNIWIKLFENKLPFRMVGF